jgi:hypothetical protein
VWAQGHRGPDCRWDHVVDVLGADQPDHPAKDARVLRRDWQSAQHASTHHSALSTHRYDYDWRWFCDQEGTTPCPPGWPGWRWDQGRAASLGRAYNYPHQSSVYLAMYLALANYDLLKATHEPRWYLNRAYKTIVAMAYQACWYVLP